jgi:uncharacterized membrane-anchored protein
MHPHLRSILRFVALASIAWIANAVAQEQIEPPDHAKAAWEAANKAAIKGPNTIRLRDQGEILLPEGYAFVPEKEATAVMELMGNQTDSRFLGMIFPRGGEKHYFVTVDYEPSGYVKDDDAKHWDAADLLKNIKEGTEAGNERRQKMGIPAIEVTRWVEPPTYDSGQHRLVWSAEARSKGVQDDDPTINYNTYVLGREGYFSLNLITAGSSVERDKSAAHELLSATKFDEGKRYTDFKSSTDKVAAYGLAALVGGLAIKKLGLLAVIGAFLLKFAKVIVIALAATGGGVMKFFRRKQPAPAELPPPSPPQ